jgi:phosphoserine phosphatase
VKQGQIRVVVLDLDGVLFDGPSAAYPLAKQLGLEEAFFGVVRKKPSLKDSIVEGSKIWKGIPVDGTLDPLVEKIPLMTGAEETVNSLRQLAYTVGCVSSGVSQFFMKPFSRRLGLDFAFSNVLGEKDGKHDGTVRYIMEGPQKAERVLQHLKERGVSSKSLASVGDGENDLELFKVSSFSIAFNPQTEKVSRSATVTVRSKDLRSILPYFAKA